MFDLSFLSQRVHYVMNEIRATFLRHFRSGIWGETERERGVKFGRPSKMNSSVAEAVRLLRENGAGIKEIAKSLQIGVGKRLPST